MNPVMSVTRPRAHPEDLALRTFMEKLRRSFSHEIRTPLGTIVNYASILEEDPNVTVEQVRSLSHRIRRQAMRTAEMLGFFIDAALLASRPLARVRTEPTALLQSVLAEAGSVSSIRTREELPREREVELDPQLVGFAWQAFLALERSSRPELPRDAELAVLRIGGATVLEFSFDLPEGERPAVEFERFFTPLGEGAPPEYRLALTLGSDLLARHGGALELLGSPVAGAGIRLRLPQHA